MKRLIAGALAALLFVTPFAVAQSWQGGGVFQPNQDMLLTAIVSTSGELWVPRSTSPAQTTDASIVWDSDDNLLTVGTGTTRKTAVDTNSSQTLTNKTLTDPVITGITGDLVVTGTIESADATTPILSTATGKTNTGYLSLTGKTSGSFKILPADATAQIVTMGIAAQTSGASTLTIPDQVGVSSDFVFSTLAQTLTNKSLTAPVLTGSTTASNITSSGFVKSTFPGLTGGIGYATGAGCAATQITNRSTGVACAGTSGAITTDSTSLAAGAQATFVVTNASVAIGDVVIVTARSGQTAGTSIPFVTTVTAGTFSITLWNSAAVTADTGAMVVNFAIIKAVSS